MANNSMKNAQDFWFLDQHVKTIEVIIPILTRKKMNKLNNPTTLLRSIRELESQSKPLPPKLGDSACR